MKIVLIGFKSCGKSSVGQALDPSYIDLDCLIEQNYMRMTGSTRSCAEIYRVGGAKYFRDLEKTVIANLTTQDHQVIASGGGSVLDADNVMRLKTHGLLVYLHVHSEILFKRLQLKPLPEFLLHAEDVYKEFMLMYEVRDVLYNQIADRIIFTENRSVQDLASEIQNGE